MEATEIIAAVLGRGEDFLLVPLDQNSVPLDKDLLHEGHDKCFEFCGLFGVVDGVAGFKLNAPEYFATMCAALPRFLEYVKEQLAPKKGNDSVDFLERLFVLEDPR